MSRPLAIALSVGLLALAPAALAQDGPSAKIVGGSPANAGEYPAQAYVRMGPFACGGSLVAPTKVLTAAHCVTTEDPPVEAPPTAFSICIGELDPTPCEPANSHTVSAVEAHEAYDPQTSENDLGMLTLTASSAAPPLRLVDTGEPALWADNVTARIIGYGTTSFQGPASGVLLEADVPMTSDSECAAAYQDFFADGDPGFYEATMVCAGDLVDGGEDACQGDSGGPLMVRDGSELVLAGVTSFGADCAKRTCPGVYARVGADPLNAWVRDRINVPNQVVGSGDPGDGDPGSRQCDPEEPPPDDGGGDTGDTSPPATQTIPAPALSVVDVVAPSVRVGFRRQRLPTALRRGFRARLNCSEACRLGATLVISRRTARRLRISRVVARGSRALGPAGTRTLRVRFSRRARGKLRAASSLGVRLKLTAVDAAGNRRVLSRSYRLRR